jgi:hypothetical protein
VATLQLGCSLQLLLLINLDQEGTNPQLIANSAAVLIQDESEDQTTNPAYKVVAPKATSFDLDGPASYNPSLPHTIENEEERTTYNVSDKFPLSQVQSLLSYMHATAHLQWDHPQNTSQFLVCSSCLYGKATRCPWCSKPSNSPSEGIIPTSPGEVVSIDQLLSNVAKLVAQMACHPTHEVQSYHCLC